VRVIVLKNSSLFHELYAAVAAPARSVRNRIVFRGTPPKVGELLMIPTRDIRLLAAMFVPRKKCAGRIMPRDWPPATRRIEESEKIRRCLQHWRDGASWAETGIYDHMMQGIRKRRSRRWDGCRTMEDVRRRYRQLDEVYRKVKAAGALDPNPDGSPDYLMRSGILIHLGPGGAPIFGRGGCHRMGMAIALDLPHVPALLGYTDLSAAPALARYRDFTTRIMAASAEFQQRRPRRNEEGTASQPA
jgi:hypothetical protein